MSDLQEFFDKCYLDRGFLFFHHANGEKEGQLRAHETCGKEFPPLLRMSIAQARGYCGIGIVLSMREDWSIPGREELALEAGVFGLPDLWAGHGHE